MFGVEIKIGTFLHVEIIVRVMKLNRFHIYFILFYTKRSQSSLLLRSQY